MPTLRLLALLALSALLTGCFLTEESDRVQAYHFVAYTTPGSIYHVGRGPDARKAIEGTLVLHIGTGGGEQNISGYRDVKVFGEGTDPITRLEGRRHITGTISDDRTVTLNYHLFDPGAFVYGRDRIVFKGRFVGRGHGLLRGSWRESNTWVARAK